MCRQQLSGLCAALIIVGTFGPPASSQPLAVDRFGDELPPGALARLGTIRMRHAHAQRVVPLPDGKTLISFGSGPTARVWDSATGKLLREFGPFPSIWSQTYPAISPDCRWLAVPGSDTLGVWDVGTGRLAYTALDNGWHTSTFAFSPDGRLLASGGNDGKVRIRHAVTGQLQRVGDKHKGRVSGLSFRDRDTLISASEDGTVKTWDAATATVRHEFTAGQVAIAAIAMTPDGKLLATGSRNEKKVHVWELPAGQKIASFDTQPLYGLPWVLAFSPDGKTLATGGYESSEIQFWDAATRRERKLAFGPERSSDPRMGGLRSLTFSPDGLTLFAPDFRQVLRCLDVNSGRDRFANDEPAGPVGDVCYSADGRTIFTSCIDQFVRSYDLTGRQLQRQPSGHRTVFGPGGRIAITTSGDEWWLMDPNTGRIWGRTKTARHGPSAMAFAPDGLTVAILTKHSQVPPGPQRGELQLHDAATGQMVKTFEDAGFGQVLKFTPDGRTLALVERDSQKTAESIHLWDAATGRTTARISVPQGWYSREIAFSPEGQLVAVPSMERQPAPPAVQGASPMVAAVAILELAGGRERQRLRLEPSERTNEIYSVRFAPDGRTLLLGMDDGNVRQWELATGQERRRFVGASGAATTLNFSPDGRVLASGYGTGPHLAGSGEGSVLLWALRATKDRSIAPLPTDRIGRDALWTELGNTDAAAAAKLLDRLAADPNGAIAIIQERVAVAAPNDDHLRQLIADLDSPKFATRTKAAAELERLNERAHEALRQALAGKPSAEVRLQVERLLAKLDGTVEAPETIRVVRAVEVLEMIETADARRLLSEFAKGDPSARLTREAQASLGRMRR